MDFYYLVDRQDPGRTSAVGWRCWVRGRVTCDWPDVVMGSHVAGPADLRRPGDSVARTLAAVGFYLIVDRPTLSHNSIFTIHPSSVIMIVPVGSG